MVFGQSSGDSKVSIYTLNYWWLQSALIEVSMFIMPSCTQLCICFVMLLYKALCDYTDRVTILVNFLFFLYVIVIVLPVS